ncbi:PIG-P-domain-containing protein [Clavulina sp. PMI_390]|nr:PIG-P-domain-containing protein [Clavulina sp. PMI_390]
MLDETSNTSPAEAQPPAVPPTDTFPATRAREFYGFVALVSTALLFIAYVLWGLLPGEWLWAAGIQWYPNREWAILLPAWSVMLILFAYFGYLALALYSTPSLSSLSCITDEYAWAPSGEESAKFYEKFAALDTIPEIYDMPIGLVNRVLYHHRDTDGMAQLQE